VHDNSRLLELLSTTLLSFLSNIFGSSEPTTHQVYSLEEELIPLAQLPNRPSFDSYKFAMKFRYVPSSDNVHASDQNSPFFLLSSSLKFNAQVEWWEEYIACVSHCYNEVGVYRLYIHTHSDRYDALKKYIYHLEKQQHEALLQSHDIDSATERTSLVDRAAQLQDTDVLFQPLLDAELQKISSFYALQEKQLLLELSELEELVKEQDDLGMLAGRFYGDNWDEDEDEDEDDWQSAERSQDPSTSKRRRRASTSVGRALSQGGG
jgi:hypothetical protein